MLNNINKNKYIYRIRRAPLYSPQGSARGASKAPRVWHKRENPDFFRIFQKEMRGEGISVASSLEDALLES